MLDCHPENLTTHRGHHDGSHDDPNHDRSDVKDRIVRDNPYRAQQKGRQGPQR